MAIDNSNTNTYFDALPNAEILYSDLANALEKVDVSTMTQEDRLHLAHCCQEAQAGLCHCLSFIGDTLISFAQSDVHEFTPESLCQLGHGITSIGQLLPALGELGRVAFSGLERQRMGGD